MISTSGLHYYLIRHIIDHGFVPDNDKIAGHFDVSTAQVVSELSVLQEIHGLVLHPHEPKVWAIHPFSLAPTNFFLQSSRQKWWSNCAWCSLGAATLIEEDLVINTTLGSEGERLTIEIRDGAISEEDLVVHFPIPMTKAWDNVIYTCSTMLFFRSEVEVDDWCKHHQIPKGDVQPITRIWPFARKWYGNHLNQNWEKWTRDEAKAIFREFGLTHTVWQLPESEERF